MNLKKIIQLDLSRKIIKFKSKIYSKIKMLYSFDIEYWNNPLNLKVKIIESCNLKQVAIVGIENSEKAISNKIYMRLGIKLITNDIIITVEKLVVIIGEILARSILLYAFKKYINMKINLVS